MTVQTSCLQANFVVGVVFAVWFVAAQQQLGDRCLSADRLELLD
jgi:hypothetical protein